MTRFWFAVVTDIVCIGIVGGCVIAKNGMAVVDMRFFLFLFICLVACFPFIFFVVLDRVTSKEVKQ